MRIRSAICLFLILTFLCTPFQAGADTLTLPASLKVINSLAYAGLKKDKVVFPAGVEYIADDAFQDAEFVGTGVTGSYAYHWCVSHGFAWAPDETITGEKAVDKEANYSGRTTWQRFPQKYYLKATVKNNKGDGETQFNAEKVKYNIRMTLHIDEVYDKGGNTVTRSEIKQTSDSISMTVSSGVTPINYITRLNSITIALKGWNGPDEEDDSYDSFQKDTDGYTIIYKADWIKNKAYNVKELMYDEQGNVAKVYDENGKETGDRYKHLDLRPEVWEGAVISVNTGNNTVSIYHPGDLTRDYHTYDLLDKKNYCSVSQVGKNLIIDPRTGAPYKKLRVKITASFNNSCRIAFHESEIDNVFVSVVSRD